MFSFDSFDQIENYYKDLRQSSNPDIKIFIIGNKADLEERRVVKKEEGMLLKERLGLDYFEETSAKTGYNIHKVFSSLV
jgi:GTPase SAR1 family protein